MSYQLYHTDAVILRSAPRGESDKVFTLYTREFGLAYAQAKAVREEKSRLRYALPDLSRSTISLVRGKAGWRVVGAAPILVSIGIEPTNLAALARISALVSRLVYGEGQNAYLFDSLAGAHQALAHDEARVQEIEVLGVARVLFALGYLAPGKDAAALFETAAYMDTDLDRTASLREDLLRAINTAITETQL